MVANKNLQRADRDRKKEAERHGRVPAEKHRERNIGHDIVSMKRTYLIQTEHPAVAEFRYTVPLAELPLLSDTDVTLLHLAEHLAFGPVTVAAEQEKEAFKLGGWGIRAVTTKSLVSFWLPFFPTKVSEAAQLFTRFIAGIAESLSSEDFSGYKEELREELSESSPITHAADQLRATLFSSIPHRLSSGGDLHQVAGLTQERVQGMREVLASKGVVTLAWPKSSSIQAKDILTDGVVPFTAIPQTLYAPVVVRQQSVVSEDGVGILLPTIHEQTAVGILTAFDYVLNDRNLRDRVQVNAATYPGATLFSLQAQDIVEVMAMLVECMDAGFMEEMVEYSGEIQKERVYMTDQVVRDVLQDWVTGCQNYVGLHAVLKLVREKLQVLTVEKVS